MSRAVCNNCWTWYANGETVCPNCRVPLITADAGALAFTAGGPAQQPSPAAAPAAPGMAPALTPPSFNWVRWLPIGGVLAIAVIAVAVFANLNIGGPATASDGSFSVKAPGWHPTTFSVLDGKRIVLALETRKNGGKAEFAVADFGQKVPLNAIAANWDQVVASGNLNHLGHLGSLSSTTVGGAPALIVDVEGTQYSGQLGFIDYGNTTYIVALTSPPDQFAKMRDTDFAAILSSWQWLH